MKQTLKMSRPAGKPLRLRDSASPVGAAPPRAPQLVSNAPPVPAQATLESPLEVRPGLSPAKGLEVLVKERKDLVLRDQFPHPRAVERSVEARAARQLPDCLEAHHRANALLATTAVLRAFRLRLEAVPPMADPQVAQRGVEAGDELDLLDSPRGTAVMTHRIPSIK